MASRAPRLLPHLLVAGLVLVACAWWVGADGQVSVDEGVAVLQAEALADGAWTMPHPLADADPDGSAFPLRFATRTDDGYVPFAKHPLYPAVLSLAHRAGGVKVMVGLSIAGVLAAAAASASLARRLDPRLAAPTVYTVALASPLVFDSTLIIGHALAAATVGGGALAVIRHHETGRSWSVWLGLATVAGATTILLRGEGLLLVLAATAVAALVAARERSGPFARLAGVGALTAGIGVGIDRLWRGAILGGGQDLALVPQSGGSWVSDRLEALATILGRVGYGDDGRGAVLVLSIVALGVAGVLLRRGAAAGAVTAAAVLSAALAFVWGGQVPPSPIPGILLAFPALWFGLMAGRWADVALARSLVAVSAVFALGVVLTQYDEAGGFEWGARYLALALPLIVPVALLGLLRAIDAAPSSARTAVVGSLLAVTLVIGAASALVRRDLGSGADRLGSLVARVAPSSSLGPSDDDGRPIVVSTEFAVPQALWPVYAGARWLRLGAPDADVRSLPSGLDTRVQRLVSLGVDRFTIVTRDIEDARLQLGAVRIARVERLGAWTVAVVEPGTGE